MRYCTSLRDQQSSESWGKKFVSKCCFTMTEDHLTQEGQLQSGGNTCLPKLTGRQKIVA